MGGAIFLQSPKRTLSLQLVVVPVFRNLDMFHGTVEGRQRVRQFDELECQDEEMFVPDRQPHEECAGLLFSGSAIIHDGAKR